MSVICFILTRWSILQLCLLIPQNYIFWVDAFYSKKWGNASIIYIILFLQNGNNILSAESFLYPRSETCTCSMLCFSMLYLIEVVSLVWFGFITHDQFSFSSMGSRCHYNEWVWNSSTKLCWIASGKWSDSRLSL